MGKFFFHFWTLELKRRRKSDDHFGICELISQGCSWKMPIGRSSLFYPGTVRGCGIARYPILILFKALAGWLAHCSLSPAGCSQSGPRDGQTLQCTANHGRERCSIRLLSLAPHCFCLFVSPWRFFRVLHLSCIDSLWTGRYGLFIFFF